MSFVVRKFTVGMVGGVRSITSSLLVGSVAESPPWVAVAVTSYTPSAKTTGMTKVQVSLLLSVKFPSPSLYVTPATFTVRSSAESAVPFNVGLVFVVIKGITPGVVGRLVSTVNSFVVVSVELLPAASVAVAITS